MTTAKIIGKAAIAHIAGCDHEAVRKLIDNGTLPTPDERRSTWSEPVWRLSDVRAWQRAGKPRFFDAAPDDDDPTT